MASSKKSAGGSARTAPKGRATRARNEASSRTRIGPTMQWILVVLAITIVLGVLLYVFRDVSTPLNGLGTTPVTVVADTASSAGS